MKAIITSTRRGSFNDRLMIASTWRMALGKARVVHAGVFVYSESGWDLKTLRSTGELVQQSQQDCQSVVSRLSSKRSQHPINQLHNDRQVKFESLAMSFSNFNQSGPLHRDATKNMFFYYNWVYSTYYASDKEVSWRT